MSKTYFGRCAAVGIAGLTAMSSIAIVASAATQASLVYELKYDGISSILMKTTVGYATGSNTYCVRPTGSTVGMEDGFNVDFAKITALTATYNEVTVGTNNSLVTTPGTTVTAWDAADFTGVSASMSSTKWNYMAPQAADPTTPVAVKLDEQYGARTGADVVVAFKTEGERTTAKNAMVTTIKNAYTALANPAAKQFKDDINAAAANAKARLVLERDTALAAAKADLAANPTDAATKAKYNADTQTANNKYNAAIAAVNASASKIVSEFNQTFTVNSFNFDLGFTVNNAPIKLGSSIGGLSPMAGATYTGISGTSTDLDNAKYWAGSAIRTDNKNYLFAGEIQPDDSFDGTHQFVYLGSTVNWVNYEVLKNGTTNGGNTNTNGSSDKDKDNTKDTTVTTWYPDSAAYRNPSEVSYLGKNGSWYTSASAATTYGGGYTGTSKSSNYSAVNSAADGKAIYFNSTTGTYSTTASTFSYVVKEATSSTNDDPYYNYFFNNGNKNNNTTTSVPAGSPAISGASKYAGWTNISAYITNRAKPGATYTINMNDGTVVPAAVLAAAKAKNVTLVFANDNGSKVTVKPGKVDTTSDLNVAVTYNVKDVKTSLVNKAKKINKGTVSTAQVRIDTDGSIGGTETVTVKFSTKRSGCTVKAYRLTESGSLKKEATGTVASTGRVNLNLTKGGSYLLVVID